MEQKPFTYKQFSGAVDARNFSDAGAMLITDALFGVPRDKSLLVTEEKVREVLTSFGVAPRFQDKFISGMQYAGEIDSIKDQCSYQAGKYGIECPNCHKSATAHVSGLKKLTRGERILGDTRPYRPVKTTCRHCGVTYTFIWR